MTEENLVRTLAVFAVLLLAGCNDRAAKPAEAVTAINPTPAEVKAIPGQGAGGFIPLRSAEVQAAIHRALRTRQNQRWQDGPWSGYAVPSIEALPNGCRTIRYTIDQQPDAPATTINACDTTPL